MSAQALGILHAVDRRLDDTRDLPDAARKQATGPERSLRDHKYTVNDLHWNAASPSRARNAAKAARNPERPFAPPSATGRDGLLQARTATMTDAASGMAHGGWIPATVRICWAGTCRGGRIQARPR